MNYSQPSPLLGAASHLSDTNGDLAEKLEDDYFQRGIVEIECEKSNRLLQWQIMGCIVIITAESLARANYIIIILLLLSHFASVLFMYISCTSVTQCHRNGVIWV